MSDSSFKVDAEKKDGGTVKETSGKAATVCQFYASGKWCRFGSRCRYLHQRDSRFQQKRFDRSKSAKTQNDDLRLSKKATSGDLAEAASSPPEAVFDTEVSRPICQFYLKHKFCGYRNNCKFSHAVNEQSSIDNQLTAQKEPSELAKEGEKPQKGNRQYGAKKVWRPMCRYIKRGGCSQGDSCNFYHPIKSVLDDVTEDFKDVNISQGDGQFFEESVRPKQGYQHHRPPLYGRSSGPQSVFKVTDLKEGELEKLRQREINQLKKLYPHGVTVTDDKDREAFSFTFLPTDPDWPYDVRHLKMIVLFPPEYPKKRLHVKLADDDQVPETVKRQVWFGMQDWLRSRFARLAENGQVELIMKPLLKLLDRSLEDLFTEGLKLYQKELMAKASGIELVSASVLNDTYNQTSDEESEEEEEGSEEGEDLDEEEYDSGTESGETEEEDNDEDEANVMSSRVLDPVKKGIEVRLQHLQLKDAAATLYVCMTKLMLQCGRCKNTAELSLPANRATIAVCSKCHEEQLLQLRPAMAHQFSSVIGYLDTENCSPVDLVLVDCHFLIGCMDCSKETKLEGLPHGQMKQIWCSCHKKLQIAVETVRFTQLRPSDLLDCRSAVVLKEKKKDKKDPAIQEGKPLPGYGTCKHFKKSFRWLRFPCCGKAYPCDECHDEAEAHFMQFANRMICGFCAKEQTFAADRACVMCGSSMTKRSSSHWEGGKGCRDVIKMSRNDKKKYSNTNKTISKKSQTKPRIGAKKTKLRHS